jgi:hypothetical protein
MIFYVPVHGNDVPHLSGNRKNPTPCQGSHLCNWLGIHDTESAKVGGERLTLYMVTHSPLMELVELAHSYYFEHQPYLAWSFTLSSTM